MLKGYKTSVFMSQSGITVAVDTLFRFMSTISCLDQINMIKKNSKNEKEFKDKV